MVRPNKIKKYPVADLKLGIKSSLPNVKATLALLFLSWKASNQPAELEYSKSSGTGIAIADALKDALIAKLNPIYSMSGITDDVFIEKVNNNQLFKSQLEALIVAFQLVWKVCKIHFVDTTKAAAAERTGGERYPKKITYTINMDLLDVAISLNEGEFLKVLLKWLGLNIAAEEKYESALVRSLSALSESAAFKFEEGGNDVVFNLEGVYEQLLQTGESVDIDGENEPKGPLRILKSSLSEGLNSYLSYSNKAVTAGNAYDNAEFSAYYRRVAAFLSLSSFAYLMPDKNDGASAQETTGGLFDPEETRTEIERLKGGYNVLLYGVPGSGKSHTVNSEYCVGDVLKERVVFHPDYTNTDFVGQILPKVTEDGVTYQFTPGPFTRLLKKAWNNPGKACFLLVEEINRGNAPAIFGEIFQLLDRDKNGKSVYEISNTDIAREVYGDNYRLEDLPMIYLPSNFFVVATMNTSDQNVFTLDTAFQRRWDMRMIKNDISKATHANVKILDTTVSWRIFAETINNLIMDNNSSLASSEDKRLGAYFIGEKDLTDVDRFPEKVIKYLWDDAFKFARQKLFSEKYHSLEEVISDFKRLAQDSRWDIFNPTITDLLKNPPTERK